MLKLPEAMVVSRAADNAMPGLTGGLVTRGGRRPGRGDGQDDGHGHGHEHQHRGHPGHRAPPGKAGTVLTVADLIEGHGTNPPLDE